MRAHNMGLHYMGKWVKQCTECTLSEYTHARAHTHTHNTLTRTHMTSLAAICQHRISNPHPKTKQANTYTHLDSQLSKIKCEQIALHAPCRRTYKDVRARAHKHTYNNLADIILTLTVIPAITMFSRFAHCR